MTTKEFIENLNFSYFKTYSLLRLEESRSYNDELNVKLKNTIDEIERSKVLSLMIRGTKELLVKTGLPHPTAKETGVFIKNGTEYEVLQQILSTDFSQQYDWMCAPVFREMIEFYDSSHNIVSLLNVCLSCDRIENDSQDNIKTDCTIFDKLRTFFFYIGNPLQDK